MHILYATQAYKPAYRIGGPIVSVSATAEELVRRGHRVTVVTAAADLGHPLDVPLNQPVNVDGVEVWYFRPDNRFTRKLPFISQSANFVYCPLMPATIERLMPQVDIVHTHAPYTFPGLAAGRAAIRYRKPLVYHQRGTYLPAALRYRRLKKRVYISLVERPLMRKASTVVALTRAELQGYRNLGVQTPCRIIPNGIDVSLYRPPRELPSLNLRDDCLPILFLGRLHPTKGADRLLEAFIRVHARIPKAALVLAGPDQIGLQARFRRLASERRIQEKVWFPGVVTGSLKLALLHRAVLFCLPSHAEGFSMAILEALATATPVLLSPGCNFPEVEAAGAGLIVSQDPVVLGEALVKMISDPIRLSRMGQLGRDLVARNYNWPLIIDQLVEVYEDTLARTRRTSTGSMFKRLP
jgi:glycosyltransferase involved in cell wall biosynthesis